MPRRPEWRRQRISQAMRQAVAVRLGVNPGEAALRPCTYCPTTLTVDWRDPARVRFLDADGRTTPELDHVDALANGGAHHETNLVLSCLPCNRSKGACTVGG